MLEEADTEEKKEKKPGFFARLFKKKSKNMSKKEISDIIKKQSKEDVELDED